MGHSSSRRGVLTGLGSAAVAGYFGDGASSESGPGRDDLEGATVETRSADSLPRDDSEGAVESEQSGDERLLNTTGLEGIELGEVPVGGESDDETEFDDEKRFADRSKCTSVRIPSFDWNATSSGDDSFRATLRNEADTEQTVTVAIEFWQSVERRRREGSVFGSISIGAQATETVTIETNAPTADIECATIRISEQNAAVAGDRTRAISTANLRE
jgi:hypothetical protein